MTRGVFAFFIFAGFILFTVGCGGGGGNSGGSPGIGVSSDLENKVAEPVLGPYLPTDSTQVVEMGGMRAEVLKDASGLPTGVKLTWVRQPAADGGYNVYRDTAAMNGGEGDPAKKVTSSPVPNPGSGSTVTYDDLDFDKGTGGNQPPVWGTTYYYRVTNINDTDDESDVSNELNITIGANISGFNPGSASILDTIIVEGSGFGGSQESGDKVEFTGPSSTWIGATVNSWADAAINVDVPVGAITGHVRVVLEDTKTIESSTDFTVIAPAITGINASSGRVGDTITITGTDFEDIRNDANGKVFFGSVEVSASDYTSWTDTEIQVKVPEAAESDGDIKVKSGNNESNVKEFDVLPKITSVSPDPQEVGESVTISGYAFGSAQGNSFVEIGGSTASVTNWSATSIACTVPTGLSASVDVKVTVKADTKGDSGEETLTSNIVSINVKPDIDSLDDDRKTVTEQLTISGDGFGAARGTSTVWFDNGTPGDDSDDSTVGDSDYVSWGDEEIVVEIPDDSKTGSVYVRVDSVDSSGESITIVLTPPNLTGAGQI